MKGPQQGALAIAATSARALWPLRHPTFSTLVLVVLVLLAGWLVKLLREYQGVGRARLYWAGAQGLSGGLLYVALGDSTGLGVGASRPDRGYVGLLADNLRQQTGRAVLVVNLSISGAKVQDVLDAQLPQLRGLNPDVVTVAVGANDVGSYDRKEFTAQVNALTAALPGGTFIADVPWFIRGRPERHAREQAQIVRRSADLNGLMLVPLHHALRRRGRVTILTDFAADWFHPNDRAYRAWAAAFWTMMTTCDCPALIAQTQHSSKGCDRKPDSS